MSTRRKILIGLAACTCAVLALLGQLLWSGYREAIQSAETTTRGYAAILETRFDATLRRADAILQRVVRLTPVAALNQSAVSDNGRVDQMLKSDLTNFPELAGLYIFDANGDLLYSSAGGRSRLNIADREHFQVLRDNPKHDAIFSQVLVAKSTGRPGITFARAIRDGEGVFRGVVSALIELEHFQRLYQSLNVGAKGSIAIYRSDSFTQVLRWPFVEGRTNVPLPKDSPTRTAFAGGATTVTQEFISSTDGEPRIYSLNRLSAYPFFVGVGVGRNEVLVGWRERAQIAAFATLLVMGLLTGLVYQLWRAHGNQAWIAAIVEASTDAIVSRDLKGNVLSWNRGAETLFGYSAAEMIGQNISRIVPEALRGELRLGFEQSMDSGGRTHDSVRRAKDGRLINVAISAAPIRGVATNIDAVAITFRDITARMRAEEASARLAAVTETSNDAIFIRDIDNRILYWNDGARRMYGYTPAEVMGRTSTFLVPTPLLDQHLQNVQSLQQGVAPADFETVRLRKDGTSVDVSISVTFVKDSEGKNIGSAVIARDITGRKHSEREHALLASIVESSNDAIVGRATDDTIVSWNIAAERMFGWSAAEAVGQPFRHLLSQTPESKRRRYFEMVLRGEPVPSPTEDVRLRKDGSSVHVETTLSAVRDSQGAIVFVSCIMRDVTERMKAERHIEQLATKDALTGLYNRSMLIAEMHSAIARAARSQAQMVAMFVDLDQFKGVNDTLGHAAGDELLRECAQRLVACVREVDIVARLGGDEFVVLLTNVSDADDISGIAGRMLKVMTTPYHLNGHDAQISASIGICFYPTDGRDVETLMKNADIAMYHAKSQGRNNFQYYAEEMNQRMVQRLQLERELATAVERHEFVLHYQPQIAIGSGEIAGAESLIRWQHPKRGLLPPASFIAVAEETGLIVPIGEWVLNHACETIKAWRAKGVRIPYVVVNVSAAQLRDSLVASVRDALATHGIEASWLVLEITETMLMARVEEAISILRRIRDLGIRIAMDDFGTGYSSLSVLQRLPIDTLKVDRSFVSAIDDETNSPRACAIIGAIIAIAKELHLNVVAEGVETNTQLAFLRTLECDTYQGFLNSKPMDTMSLEVRYAAAIAGQGGANATTSTVTLELRNDAQ